MPPRKRTIFAPCAHHAPMYESATRRRCAEVFVEGGWPSPCHSGQCEMRPGTDFYTAAFVLAHPRYTVGDAS